MKPIFWHDTRLDKTRVDEFHSDLADFLAGLGALDIPEVTRLIKKHRVEVIRDSFQNKIRVLIDGK